RRGSDIARARQDIAEQVRILPEQGRIFAEQSRILKQGQDTGYCRAGQDTGLQSRAQDILKEQSPRRQPAGDCCGGDSGNHASWWFSDRGLVKLWLRPAPASSLEDSVNAPAGDFLKLLPGEPRHQRSSREAAVTQSDYFLNSASRATAPAQLTRPGVRGGDARSSNRRGPTSPRVRSSASAAGRLPTLSSDGLPATQRAPTGSWRSRRRPRRGNVAWWRLAACVGPALLRAAGCAASCAMAPATDAPAWPGQPRLRWPHRGAVAVQCLRAGTRDGGRAGGLTCRGLLLLHTTRADLLQPFVSLTMTAAAEADAVRRDRRIVRAARMISARQTVKLRHIELGQPRGGQAQSQRQLHRCQPGVEANGQPSVRKSRNPCWLTASFDLRHMTRDFWLDHRQSVQNGNSKLVVHLSHNSVRYYAACILLGLVEFMRHSCIYHGNLSLCSIALDYYGPGRRLPISTRRFAKKSAKALSPAGRSAYAAMLGVLHCDNIRHFSISHMHSTADDHRRRDVFVGICPKCRLTAECMDPEALRLSQFRSARSLHQEQNCHQGGDARRILESLQPSWMEADLWLLGGVRILELKRKCWQPTAQPQLLRGASESCVRLLKNTGAGVECAAPANWPAIRASPANSLIQLMILKAFESDSDAVGQIRISRASMGAASSFAAGTAMTGFGGSQGATGNFAQRDAIKEAKNERLWQRRQELQRARVSSSMYFDQASKGASERESWKTPLSATQRTPREWRHAEISIRVRVRVDAGADSSAAGRGIRASVEAAQPQTVGLVPARSTRRRRCRSLGWLRGRCQNGRQWPDSICHGRLDFDDEGPARRPMPLGPGKSALMPQTKLFGLIGGGKNAQKPKSSGSGFSNDFNLDAGYGEFEFKGYQLMMEHNYFIGLQQGATPSKPATNLGDDADRRMVGSYFTSRSRVLYSLFG
uniref:Protein kinase domain-containing protein n=1 Tax=Macrostomum lignano TaxID=282301 RepID=A0A1I8JRV8_9PLAT